MKICLSTEYSVLHSEEGPEYLYSYIADGCQIIKNLGRRFHAHVKVNSRILSHAGHCGLEQVS